MKEIDASYDALVDLLDSVERFLCRLEIYTRIPLTAGMASIIVKIMAEILSTLALATKQVEQGRLSGSYFRCCGGLTQRSAEKFVKKILGENEIETVLHRLDRLTLDEARATGVQILEVVYGLVQHRKAVMDGEQMYQASSSLLIKSSYF